MDRIVVLGAGVVGQVYAGLLAEAGHEVSMIARGARAEHLRSAGLVLETADRQRRRPVRVITSLAEAGPVDVLIVAVRADQLTSVQDDIAACPAPTVVCMTAPLGHRESFAQEAGPERTVFAFSGIGGAIDPEGAVRYHVVRQQPTVVDVAAPHGRQVARMMRGAGLAVRSETQMPAWLATHAVFITGIGSALLATDRHWQAVADSRERARQLVAALTEGFDALQAGGYQVRPAGLRMIFGRVPAWIAARYWQRQFASPMVRTSIEPHVLATRDSEFGHVAGFALDLTGNQAPRYRSLVAPFA